MMAYLTENISVCGAAVTLAAFAACASPEAPVPATSQPAPSSRATELQRMAAQFAPTELSVDLSKLQPADRTVLTKLVQASKIVDALFLRQVWEGNEALLIDLPRDTTEEGRARLHNFLINKGPWSRIDHNKPFVEGVPSKPEGANFYPAGASKAEIEKWIGT